MTGHQAVRSPEQGIERTGSNINSMLKKTASITMLVFLSVILAFDLLLIPVVSAQPEESVPPEVVLEAYSSGFYRPALTFIPLNPDSLATIGLVSAGNIFNVRLRFALDWSGYVRFQTELPDTSNNHENSAEMNGPVTVIKGYFSPDVGKAKATLTLSEKDEEPFYQGSVSFYESNAEQAADAAAEEILRQLTGMVPPFRSRIVCVEKQQNDVKELVLLDYDGGNRFQLTQDKSIALSPSWSPDGSKIVFCTYRASDDADLAVVDLDKRIIKGLVMRKGTDAAPSWSPDGKWIVFAGSMGSKTDLYLVRPDGGGMRNITHSSAINTSPSWSPTSRDIVFMSDRSGTPQIYRMDRDGSNLLRLTYDGRYNADPSWSPAGDRIAYVRQEDNGFQVRIMDPTGDVDVPLTSEPGDHLEPSWSPDGMKIAYGFRDKVWVMNADGTGKRALKSRGLMPDWSKIPEDSSEMETSEIPADENSE